MKTLHFTAWAEIPLLTGHFRAVQGPGGAGVCPHVLLITPEPHLGTHWRTGSSQDGKKSPGHPPAGTWTKLGKCMRGPGGGGAELCPGGVVWACSGHSPSLGLRAPICSTGTVSNADLGPEAPGRTSVKCSVNCDGLFRGGRSTCPPHRQSGARLVAPRAGTPLHAKEGGLWSWGAFCAAPRHQESWCPWAP